MFFKANDFLDDSDLRTLVVNVLNTEAYAQFDDLNADDTAQLCIGGFFFGWDDELPEGGQTNANAITGNCEAVCVLGNERASFNGVKKLNEALATEKMCVFNAEPGQLIDNHVCVLFWRKICELNEPILKGVSSRTVPWTDDPAPHLLTVANRLISDKSFVYMCVCGCRRFE